MLGALLSLSSAGAHAQVYKEIKGSTGSMKVLITCVVIERGVEKVLDVGLGDLVAYVLGRYPTWRGQVVLRPALMSPP